MRKSERFFIFVLLLLATGFGQAVFAIPPDVIDTGGEPITQLIFGGLYLIIFGALVLRNRAELFRLLKAETWISVLCIWALLSVGWSVDPGLTLRRSLAITGTSIAGLYLALKLDPRDQLRMMASVIGIGAVCSLVVAMTLPSIGIAHGGQWEGGGWQGVYNQKNSLGRMMSFGGLAFGLLAISEHRWRLLRTLLFSLCCALLLMSRSASAVVVTVLVLGLIPLRKLLRLRLRKLLPILILLLPLIGAFAFYAVEYSDELLQSLGRSPSLTGRVPLWHLVLNEIGQRPIFGWGFGAFWSSSEGRRVSDMVNWDVIVPNAHNGFLEIWLGLGLIGLTMMLISLVRALVFSVRFAWAKNDPIYMWPLLVVMFTLFYSITEVSIPSVNSIEWMAYAASAFWLARFARQETIAPEGVHDMAHAYSL